MNRLESIASLVPIDSKVIDIGTDHAYLPIYLYKNNITRNITATDISENVLVYSRNSLIKNGLDNKIELILSDGFNNVFDTFDVAIITGMGTNTIKHILDYNNIPNTLIIGSQKDIYELRLYMYSINYKIDKEIVILDKNKYYVIIRYVKGKEKLTKEELLIGKSNNIMYYKYLLNKYNDIYNKSKDNKYLEYIKIIERMLDQH